MACPLCQPEAETVLWRDAHCRVIAVDQIGYPGFCRVIWQEHVRDMTDLPPPQRDHLMNIVWAIEAAQREVLNPFKINLASLGNQVPHLHWHVVPRFEDDPHFPDAVWATPRREGASRKLDHAAFVETVRRTLAVLVAPSF